jgi:hypothetical protein
MIKWGFFLRTDSERAFNQWRTEEEDPMNFFVMEKFDRDEEVNRLYDEFIETVTPLNNIVYGECSKTVH